MLRSLQRGDKSQKRDCITQLLYDYLLSQEPSNQMIAIEHWFAFIISQQERHGLSLIWIKQTSNHKLTSIRAELKDELQQMVAPKVEEMKSPLVDTEDRE